MTVESMGFEPSRDAAVFCEKDGHYAQAVPSDVRDRAVRMTIDRLSEYPSVFSCKALAPKLGVGPEKLRRWVHQAQIDAGEKAGPSSAELEEIKRLRAEVREL